MANRLIRSDHEWFEIINECRKSGLSDKSWCENNNIRPSTFYTAVTRLRSKSYDIPESSLDDNYDFTSNHDVVKVQISQELSPDEINTDGLVVPNQTSSLHLDNSHTIEIQMGDTIVRLSNNVNPVLAKMITHSLFGGNHYAG